MWVNDNVLYIVGVNLLIGTEAGLMLLDRSGQGKGTCHYLPSIK